MTSTYCHKVDIRLTLRAPYATAGDVGLRLFDISLPRDGSDKLILPQSLLKGVFRGAAIDIANKLPNVKIDGKTFEELTTDLFGAVPQKGSVNKFDATALTAQGLTRGSLLFSDLLVENSGASISQTNSDIYARVAINPDTGASDQGQLVFIEAPFPIGTEIVFKGEFTLIGSSNAPDTIAKFLDILLSRIPAIGSQKSSGFGKLLSYSIGDFWQVSPTDITTTPSNNILMEYKVDRPFVVDSQMINPNLMRGDKIVPGAAIKGSLAVALHSMGTDGAEPLGILEKIHFGHASPVNAEGKKHQELPKSLAIIQGNEGPILVDLAFSSCPNEGKVFLRPAWKHAQEELAMKQLSLQHLVDFGPNFVGRTRGAIDPDTGTAAYDTASKTGKLFSVNAVNPTNYTWVGRIIFPSSASDTVKQVIVGLLKNGLPGLGKTKATIFGEAVTDQIRVAPATVGQKCVIKLVTKAILNNINELRNGRSAFGDYEAYFAQYDLKLKDAFASQSALGGYVSIRYPVDKNGYRPWIATDPGSVFVFEDISEKGKASLDNFAEFGLPPTGGLKNDWQSHPFLCESGFGEVSFDNLLPAASQEDL